MPAIAGSAAVVTFANAGGVAQTILGGTLRSIDLAAEIPDATTANSPDLYRTLISCGTLSATISMDVVFDDDAGIEAVRTAAADRTTRAMAFTVAGLGSFTGVFKLASLAFAAPFNAPVTANFSAESAGVITFTTS